jgi:beta-lactam-binding protein with PASTA domain
VSPDLAVSPASAAPAAPMPAADVHCVAPGLKGMKLKAARETVRAAHCALGKDIKKPGANNRHGKVVRQTVKPGTNLATESVVRVALGQGR